MTFKFTKYQGTGNDFIMIDCVEKPEFSLTNQQIEKLCHRRFGIGADGVILIYSHPTLDFKMEYFNSDGTKSFCGNGARCAVRFAKSLRLFQDKANFLAIDGKHEASLEKDSVSLKMNDVKKIEKDGMAYVIDTGSPHFIEFTTQIDNQNIVRFGQNIRFSTKYKAQGINVNLVEEVKENQLQMLTYERGVEDETYSCGTGATAVALAYGLKNNISDINVNINVKGGELKVVANKSEDGFHSICLIGPAKAVYTGEYSQA